MAASGSPVVLHHSCQHKLFALRSPVHLSEVTEFVTSCGIVELVSVDTEAELSQ